MAATLRKQWFHTPLSLQSLCSRCRQFATSIPLQSGHNRWSTIKHDKGKNDAIKNKQRGILSKELTHVSKLYGPDPNSNPRLATVVEKAKKAGFPKASIQAAIARGQGLSSSGAQLEPVTLEAIVPPSVAVVIECLTESKARTLQDLRTVLKNAKGISTPTGYLFERKGKIVLEYREGTGVDEVLEPAVDAGAIDVIEEDGSVVVYTEPAALKQTSEALTEALDLTIRSSEIIWDPNKDTMVEVDSEEDREALEKCLAEIEEESSVQAIYTNAIP